MPGQYHAAVLTFRRPSPASEQHLDPGKSITDEERLIAKFVFTYHAPTAPADMAPPTPEQMEAVMGAWNDWAASVGSGMIDFGTPLAGGSRVASDGTTAPSERDVVGYTIIEADSKEAALYLAKTHPHLHMPGGCEIEVHEAQPIPGT